MKFNKTRRERMRERPLRRHETPHIVISRGNSSTRRHLGPMCMVILLAHSVQVTLSDVS